MKNTLLILMMTLTLSGCTIVGNFYLLNHSQENLDVTINIRSVNKEIADNYVVRIDNITGKKIKHSTYKKMKKRLISIDSTNKQFRFILSPNEIAHIGSGPNTRLWNVKNVLISKGPESIKLNGSDYGQFKIHNSGFFKYVGVKEIR